MENMGPFRLEAVLGRGGMGTVYRAKFSETDETVAVKVLSPAFTADDHFRNRFESEIKALLKLDHPNIVRLVSYGQFEHNLYFAMELVEGKSLFQMQRDGEVFHWREVIRIAKNVALGLRHAHDRGVIHRDLKPGNLLKAFSGIIKITDFGIAKSFGSNQDTGTNVLGTVDFMSPEQAKGQPVTFRSDLYSLGAVMYTLLGGRPPFTANSVEESMRNLTRVPAPKISRIAPDVPKVIDDLIAQLLEKDPEKRVSTALSLYHHLKQAEQRLKDTSQAITAEKPSGANSEKTDFLTKPQTSVDLGRGMAHTVPHDIASDEQEIEDLSANSIDEEDSIGTKTGPGLIKADDEGRDYFTSVTEFERKVHLDITEEEDVPAATAGKIVLAGMLVIVTALAGLGLYYANQIPSADSLFYRIQQEWDRPQKRFTEIEQFLSFYPDHEKTELVQDRKVLAKAYHKIIELRGQSRKSTGISEVEQSFLDIVDGDKSDLPKLHEKMLALITLYENNESLAGDDPEVVDAAKALLVPMESRAKEQERKVRSNIENQIERAKTLPRQEAIAAFKSVIELNERYEWVADSIAVVRQEIEELENSK